MSKQTYKIKEAKQLLAQGKRLSHPSFTDDEWVQGLQNGMYEFEDGVLCPELEFWSIRESMHSFSDGWYEV